MEFPLDDLNHFLYQKGSIDMLNYTSATLRFCYKHIKDMLNNMER